MQVCRKCRRPKDNSLLIECPTCHAPFIEDTDLPQQLSDDDLDRVAARVVKSLKQEEDLERIAEKVRISFGKEEWKTLANQVMKSLHIVHDVDKIAKALLGMWRFL